MFYLMQHTDQHYFCRKYPTKQNIQNQKLVEEDKIRRGEIIKPDNSRFNKKFSKRREHNFKDKQEFKPNQNKRRNKKVIPKLDTTQNDLISEKAVKEECNGVQAFQGLGKAVLQLETHKCYLTFFQEAKIKMKL